MAVRVTFQSRHDAYLLTQALLEAAAVAYKRGDRLADSYDDCDGIPPCNATPEHVERLVAV